MPPRGGAGAQPTTGANEVPLAPGAPGYAALGVRLTPTSELVRHVFLRAAPAGGGGFPADRALLAVGLPAALDEAALLQLFSAFGAVERAALHASRLSVAVLYTKSAARDKALRAAAKGRVVELDPPEPAAPYGLKAWVEGHKALTPGNAALQRELDAWTAAHEAAEAARREAALAAMEGDGWTVVRRQRGRRKSTDGGGVSVGAVSAGAAAAAAAAARAKRPAAPGNFYRFQQRDKRRSELLELRERFEDDKRRLGELKAARKFMPVG
jgi:ribosomal RNA-processing protein 7